MTHRRAARRTGSPEAWASRHHSPVKGDEAPRSGVSRAGARKMQGEPGAVQPEVENAQKLQLWQKGLGTHLNAQWSELERSGQQNK